MNQALLTPEELHQLNACHAQVLARIGPLLDGEAQGFARCSELSLNPFPIRHPERSAKGAKIRDPAVPP